MRPVAILAFAIWAAGDCPAQDSSFNETHRVVLRNGNMLDGVLREQTPSGIILLYSPSVRMFIRWGEIRSVEEIKIRTLHSQPKRVTPPAPLPDAEPEKPGPDANPKDPPPPPNLKLPEISASLLQKINDLLDRVRSAPRISRGRFAQMLDSMGTEARQYMAVRIELLADDLVRWVGSEIGRSADRSIVPPLRDRLRSERPVVRAVAIQLLQELRDVESGPIVAGLLKDPDEGVRGNAALALPDIGDESTIEPLLNLARDPSPSIRKAALRAVTEHARRKGKLAQVVTYWSENVLRLNQVQKEDVAEAAGQLIPSLGSGSPEADESRATAEEMLMNLTRDLEPAVRAAAFRSLGGMNTQNSREVLVGALASETNDVTLAGVINTLRDLRERAAIPELIERLAHSNDRVRDAAWDALKMITGEVTLPNDIDEWKRWQERQ